jgi:hypothetical protein
MGQFEHERIANGWPEICPVTGRPFFMGIEDSSGDLRATYGGPFDSFTIPEKNEDWDDDESDPSEYWYCEHYDHDAGWWADSQWMSRDEALQIKQSYAK